MQVFVAFAILLITIPLRAWGVSDPLDEAESILTAQRSRPDATQFRHAQTLVDQTLEHRPRTARAWTLSAWTHLIEHRFAEALEASRRAEDLHPGEARNLALMSDALVELGRYDEAATVTQRLVDAAPGPTAWVRAAHLRFLFGDLAGAIAIQSMAARAGAVQGEASAWIWLDLARLYLAADNWNAADAALAAARTADPALPGLPAAQARVRLARGDVPGALSLYRQALKTQVTVEDAVAAWRIACLLDDQGAARHLAALVEGLARLDTAGRSRRVLAEYFAETGDLTRAQTMARAELATRPDLYSHATLARVLARAGEATEARREAQAALVLETPDPDLRAGLVGLLGTTSRDLAGAAP